MNCTQEIFGLWLTQLIALTVLLPPQIMLWLVAVVKMSDMLKKHKKRKTAAPVGLFDQSFSQVKLSPYENWLEELEGEPQLPSFGLGNTK